MRCYSIHYNDVPGILCCGKLFRMVFCMPSILDSTFIVIKFPRFNIYIIRTSVSSIADWLHGWLSGSWVCIFSNHIFQILFLFWNEDNIFLLTRTKHCLVPACNIFWKSGEYIERVCTFAATARVTAKKKKYNEMPLHLFFFWARIINSTNFIDSIFSFTFTFFPSFAHPFFCVRSFACVLECNFTPNLRLFIVISSAIVIVSIIAYTIINGNSNSISNSGKMSLLSLPSSTSSSSFYIGLPFLYYILLFRGIIYFSAYTRNGNEEVYFDFMLLLSFYIMLWYLKKYLPRVKETANERAMKKERKR